MLSSYYVRKNVYFCTILSFITEKIKKKRIRLDSDLDKE